MSWNYLAGVIFGLLIISCGKASKIEDVPLFDAGRAFTYLEKQVSFGPRVPGSEPARACREYYYRFFDSLGLTIDTIMFDHIDKSTGQKITMINLLVHCPGTDEAGAGRYLFAAHYDCRPRADLDPDTSRRHNPIDGANDGASGVAVLMELANLLANQKARAKIDLVLLDGEDYGHAGDLSEYFLGSREMVRRNIRGQYRAAIVIDMIGDRDLNIYREVHSEKYYPSWNDSIWNIAARLGEAGFIDSVKHVVYDDHLSFMTAGIPAIDIIDFDYKYWHTLEDTPDKCSPNSLKSVGRVITQLIYGF